MAAKASAQAEISEREYQATLNDAVARTEDEIFTDALGGDELDNDGDTSLEEMGDGLEGEVEGDEAGEEEGEEGEEETAEGEEETAEGEEEGEEEGAAQGEDEEAVRDGRGRFQRQQPAIPPGRLREEAVARRQAEERASTLERQIAELQGRFTQLSTQVNAAPKQPQQQAEPKPKPDMFADPEGYEKWLFDQAEQKAEARAQARIADYAQQQQQREAQRADHSFNEVANGPRGFEFREAYGRLTSLDPRDPRAQATVRAILASPDPGNATLDWFERNGGPEYRAQILEQLAPREVRQPGRQQTMPRQAVQQARHEFRGPQRLPSLNSATGSNRQHSGDPEMLDGSEGSVFRFATR